MNHSFDVEIATKIGLNEAILLNNIKYWIDKNKANDKHLHEGTYWTYNSTRAFCQLFPYMSKAKIDSSLKNLIKEGYLITGNFNLTSYDRTKWYALTDKADNLFGNEKNPSDVEGEPFPKIGNGFPKIGNGFPKIGNGFPKTGNGFTENRKPIPDNKTNNKPNGCKEAPQNLRPPENSFSDYLNQNEAQFCRKPNIPKRQTVLEFFLRAGGDRKMAQAFIEQNDATGWYFKGSPIIKFEPLANKFINSWHQIAEKNKPKNPPGYGQIYKDI